MKNNTLKFDQSYILLSIVFSIFNYCIPSVAIADPDLEPGFPVQGLSASAGSALQAGPVINTVVGNIDQDPELEILVTGTLAGPLYAFNHDGTAVNGWPILELYGQSHHSLAQLNPDDASLEVFAAYGFGRMVAYDGDGLIMAGWPRFAANYVTSPPTTVDINNDGIDEIFIAEEDRWLHAYYADGMPIAGWPVKPNTPIQSLWTPAVADLDGDGDIEFVFANGASTAGISLFAYHHTGEAVSGYPIYLHSGYPLSFPVIGDVDGDGSNEIIVLEQAELFPALPQINIYSANGSFERQMTASGNTSYGSAPALADMDNDGFPEIILQTNESIDVWKGNGSVLPGWPFIPEKRVSIRNSSPVVGDVDGDQMPDIVVTYYDVNGANVGYVYVLNNAAQLHHRFPKLLFLGASAVPAIRDIDLDGRNEIIVTGNFWNGITGEYDKVWVFDLGGPRHAPSEWSQFLGGEKHQGYYVKPQRQNLPETDISLTITPSQLTGKAGVEMLVDYHIVNDGMIEANQVILRGTLLQQTFISQYIDVVTVTPGCSISDGMFVCDIGVLGAGESRTVTFNIIANSIGPYVSQAVAYASEQDPLVENNFSIFNLDFVKPVADTMIAMSSNATRSSSVGDHITYSLTTTNLGPDAAMDVVVVNPIPTNAVIVSVDNGCVIYTSSVLCKYAKLEVGQSTMFNIILMPTVRGVLYNSAAAGGGSYIDTVSSNDEASVSVRIKR